jgi:DNA-binding NtrC family response regulator
MTLRVLVADDDPNTRYLLEIFCREQKTFALDFVTNGKAALERMQQSEVHVLLSDIRMPLMSGDELLTAVKQQFPEVPVVIMTSYGSIEDAVDFLHAGAEDYLAKPLTKEVFLHRVGRIVERVSLTRELATLRNTVAKGGQGPLLIGRSPAMLALLQKIPTVAQTEASVVIFGESGTGKEVVAKLIHQSSRRADKPFVTLNCGSLPDTLLESELFGYKRGAFTDARADTPGLVDAADKGTLFMDEIGEISPAVQVKLLRFLQQKEYKPLGSPTAKVADVRIITATNRDLRREVSKGTFREDLYYRLNTVPLQLPMLRDRPGDIALLATHFLERSRRRLGRDVRFESSDILRKLEAYAWPGNVRELENKIEQLVVMATDGIIRADDVVLGDPGAASGPTFADGPLGSYKDEKHTLLARFERGYLTRLLHEEAGHLGKVAERAGLPRKNLWQLMRKHGLTAEAYKPTSGRRAAPRPE